jgi:soluble lytic murein transglycosylase-like protein
MSDVASMGVRTLTRLVVVLAVGSSAVQAQGQPPQPSSSEQQARTFIETGLRFEHAEGVTRDFSLAEASYCSAAKLNSAEAFVRLGWMYANGRGVTRNDAIAGSLFKRAAALGDETAQRLSDMINAGSEVLPPCLIPQTAKKSIETAPLKSLPKPSTLPKVTAYSQIAAGDKGKFINIVLSLAKDLKLDPRLALAVMRSESGYDPQALSTKGALGLMQLIPETAERFGLTDPSDPDQNIRGGMTYLKWLLSYFRGDVVMTLAAYNAGEKTVEKFGGVPPYPETMAYVQRIRSVYPVDFHPFDERAAAYRTPSKKGLKK